MNYLAIDYGEKNIGIAYKIGADPIVPSDIINYVNNKDLIRQLSNLISTKNINQIVVGMPLTLKGEKGHQARLVEEFCQDIRIKMEIPVATIDERFTSSIFKESENIDSYSAAEILNTFISRLNK